MVTPVHHPPKILKNNLFIKSGSPVTEVRTSWGCAWVQLEFSWVGLVLGWGWVVVVVGFGLGWDWFGVGIGLGSWKKI